MFNKLLCCWLLNTHRLLPWISQVVLEELGHSKFLLLVEAKDGLHGDVRGEQALVRRVLELVQLDVGKQLHDHLRLGHQLPLPGANDLGKVRRDLEGIDHAGQVGIPWPKTQSRHSY